MTAAILTAVYASYDSLKPLRIQDTPHEAICVTDDPSLHADGWTVVYEPREGVHPNLAAKTPKMCPWRYTDAETVIWIDASFNVSSWSLISDLDKYEFGQFDHPERDCIYQEADVSAGMAKYPGEAVRAQAAHYESKGHPPHWGLWATGLIVRHHTPEVEAFGEAWLAENERWTYQDQVSQPFVLRNFGLRPEIIPGFYHQNPWVLYAGSDRH